MYRFVLMSHKWYGIEIRCIDEEEAENLVSFVDAGELVLLCNEADDPEYLFGDEFEYEIIEPEG